MSQKYCEYDVEIRASQGAIYSTGEVKKICNYFISKYPQIFLLSFYLKLIKVIIILYQQLDDIELSIIAFTYWFARISI